jgi:PST family polysaccharide transporter
MVVNNNFELTCLPILRNSLNESEQNPLANRIVAAFSWRILSNSSQVLFLLLRTIILARNLEIEDFGTYGFILSVTGVTLPLVGFGMGGAFLHQSEETKDETKTSAVHFTIHTLFAVIWLAGFLLWGFINWSGVDQIILIIIVCSQFVSLLTTTPKLILTKRIVHRRLSIIQFLVALIGTVIPIYLALNGYGIFALLSIEVITAGITFFCLYIWRPVWIPKFSFDPIVAKYFLQFGSRALGTNLTSTTIDKVDDLWTGYFLGDLQLGYYNRAFALARYPRLFLGDLINTVVAGIYSELKSDRLSISKAFYWVNAFVVRAGFFTAGFLALTAPDLIVLLIGEKWLPLTNVFRLMLIFTLLDPIQKTVGKLFEAMGKPELLLKIRIFQLVLLVAGLFTLGTVLSIEGVAIAVNIMLIAGTIAALILARRFVDISYRKMFLAPTLMIVIALICSMAILFNVERVGLLNNNFVWIGLKGGSFGAIYFLGLLMIEFSEIKEMILFITQRLKKKPSAPVTGEA